jgi:Undecaprenyl-phosphate glucose phosphotransferase
MLKRQHRFFRSVLIAADGVVVIAASVLAYYIRYHLMTPPGGDKTFAYATHAIPVLVVLPLTMGALFWAGLYQPRRDQRFYSEAAAIIKAVTLGTLLTIGLLTLLRNPVFHERLYNARQFGVFFVCAGGMMLAWRYTFRLMLRWLRAQGWNLRHVAVVGSGRLGQVVCRTLSRNSWTGIKPSFVISHQPTTTRERCAGLPVLGGLTDLEAILDAHEVSGVFIALPERMMVDLPGLIARLERYPLAVRIVPDMNPRFLPMNMAVSELEGMPVLSLRESPLAGWGAVSKRVLDVVGALAAIALFAVPMLVIAALIKLADARDGRTRGGGAGPVIFRQERMSLNGRRFRIFKFRTMVHVDEESQPLREAAAAKGTDAWTKPDDPRVTRMGRFLRRTSLDELPQLFNVLIGEMSLVGPRPERPELIERFREDWRGYMLRQNVKAGMTGWAQVNGLRGNSSLKKRLQYDLFYIRNWSLMFDLRILGMTIFRGFADPNAY